MQTRRQSLAETCVSIGIGFGIAMLTQCVVAWLWAFPLRLWDNFAITVVFTIVSFIRQYFIRRLFNWLHGKQQHDTTKRTLPSTDHDRRGGARC